MKRILPISLALLGFLFPATTAARAPVVLAAASMQEALNAAADAWAAKANQRPVLSFAASSALARQIMALAPADIFISADEEWMDAVADKNLLRAESRADLVGNRLVLIAPGKRRSPFANIQKSFPFRARLRGGRLAMADPVAVPAGKYGKSALTALGLWDDVADRIAPAENVRAALLQVERGEAPLGIVYATDAKASAKVHIVGFFPQTSHPPIRYPIAILATSSAPTAEPFRRFLLSGQGRAILTRFGFTGVRR